MNLAISFTSKIIGLIIAITIHQSFYAFTSAKLGDPLPKKDGRLTLNPFKHIEPVGFIILFISSFGWGKPVNTSPSYYKNKKNGIMTVALSGIVANLCFAALFGLIFKLFYDKMTTVPTIFLGSILRYTVQYNVILAIINLIPIYPLDGYRILLSLVKPNTYFKIVQYEKIIQMILILLAFAGILNIILAPITNMLVNLFL